MTSTIILNLIVSVVAIVGLTALMRSAYLVAGERFAESRPERDDEAPQQLEQAA